MLSTRTSSTTTRIKTLDIDVKSYYVMIVLEHLPLQQGLRLAIYEDSELDHLVLEHLPLQQGLRHEYVSHYGYDCFRY